MGGSVECLLDFRPRAGRGGDKAAVVTCCLIAAVTSSSALLCLILTKGDGCRGKKRLAVLLIIDCIYVHKIHDVSPATTFTADVC